MLQGQFILFQNIKFGPNCQYFGGSKNITKTNESRTNVSRTVKLHKIELGFLTIEPTVLSLVHLSRLAGLITATQ